MAMLPLACTLRPLAGSVLSRGVAAPAAAPALLRAASAALPTVSNLGQQQNGSAGSDFRMALGFATGAGVLASIGE